MITEKFLNNEFTINGVTMRYLQGRICVDSRILQNEIHYTIGDGKDTAVQFHYYNAKKDRLGQGKRMTFSRAWSLALDRADDGRYRNYEFWIEL